MQLCIGTNVAKSFPNASYGFASSATQAFARCAAFTVGNCQLTAGVCLECTGQTGPSSELPLNGTTFALNLPDTSDTATQQMMLTVNQTCEAMFPGARLNLPPHTVRTDIPKCVTGSLGEDALAVISATQEVQQARDQIDEQVNTWLDAVNVCNVQQTWDMAKQQEAQSFANKLDGLRKNQLICDEVANAAGAVANCLSTISGATLLPVAGVACGADAVQAAAQGVSLGFQSAIDMANNDEMATVAMLMTQADYAVCMAGTKQYQEGAKSAADQLDQALFDLKHAYATLSKDIDTANVTWQSAQSNVTWEQMQVITPPAGDIWVNDNIDIFVRAMRDARRAVYLAVRAVEYEYQQSLGDRMMVLTAETPDDLNKVLTDLWAASGTRSINGNRPSNLKVILSLRDDVLQLLDHSKWAQDWQNLSQQDRLRALFREPAYNVFDYSTTPPTYLGQQIPFSIMPLQALGGDPMGVPIYANTDCAERLWSVNASVIGGATGNLFKGSSTTFTRIDLLKKNTFYSQWCSPPANGSPFQVASVDPAKNLFRDPGDKDVPVGADTFGNSAAGQSYTRARIQAYFNVSRSDFDNDMYMNGQTSELAARGLYGDYALFIPAALLSQESSDGMSQTDGLVPEQVDDVLLRFDYVSVAK
jgi:hypothetical protein